MTVFVIQDVGQARSLYVLTPRLGMRIHGADIDESIYRRGKFGGSGLWKGGRSWLCALGS